MKKIKTKRGYGFTLIELLAVIVILAIIALISVPMILNIIDKANKSAFKDSAYGIISAGELYFAEQQLQINGMGSEKTFNLPSQANVEGGIGIKGEVPEGTLKISTEGKTALALKNGRYCITKGYEDSDVTVTEDFDTCEIPRQANPNIISVSNECVTNGKCTDDEIKSDEGVKVTVQVNEGETKDFYVIADNGTELTLIMSENLGNKVAWYADAQTTVYGPITAINYLDSLTDEEWSNIPAKSYTYSGIGDDGKTRKYEDITRTMRARMITEQEADDLGCSFRIRSCPSWLYWNLYSSDNTYLPYGYWTSTAISSRTDALYITNEGRIDYFSPVGSTQMINGVYTNSRNGIRPVIELPK